MCTVYWAGKFGTGQFKRATEMEVHVAAVPANYFLWQAMRTVLEARKLVIRWSNIAIMSRTMPPVDESLCGYGSRERRVSIE